VADRVDGYATAVFELAKAEGQLERVERELFAIARTFESSTELRDALTNPKFPVERKQAILDDLVGASSSSLTTGLLAFIVARGRASELSGIVDAFIAKAAASRAKVVAEVRTAVELDDGIIERLAAALSRVTGKQVEVKTIMDPSVIGGVVAQVGDRIIDGTVSRRLSLLRQAMLSG
jgi:F-type H+-transporting ATPase subunit delta